MYVDDKPIVLGLAGEGGTGKTATANVLAPPARMQGPSQNDIWWEPLAAAAPLYEMASILQMTEGDKEFDRKAYAIHAVLVDLFGMPAFGAPPYEEVVELVYDLCCAPPPVGEKPRTFLQDTGTRVRELMPDCILGWMGRKVLSLNAFFRQEHSAMDPMPMFGVVLSDLRMENEVAWVRSTINGVAIKLTCDPEVRQERISKRDGVGMSDTQRQHATETWVASSLDDCFDAVIDTTSLKLSQQVSSVLDVVAGKLGIDLPKGAENVTDIAERSRRVR